MTIYLLVIPLLVLQVRTWLYLRKMHQNDRVLFQFCDFRRELMGFLRTDQVYNLSPQSYDTFRLLLDNTNLTVHHFHALRPAFNWRRVWRTMREMSGQIGEQEAHALREAVKAHPQVEYFMHRMLTCWATAFFAYTPFLRHKLLLRVLSQGASLLKAVGNRKWARLLEEARSMASQANEALDHYHTNSAPYCPA